MQALRSSLVLTGFLLASCSRNRGRLEDEAGPEVVERRRGSVDTSELGRTWRGGVESMGAAGGGAD